MTAPRSALAIKSTVEWTADIDPGRRRALVDAIAALRANRAMLCTSPAEEQDAGHLDQSDDRP